MYVGKTKVLGETFLLVRILGWPPRRLAARLSGLS